MVSSINSKRAGQSNRVGKPQSTLGYLSDIKMAKHLININEYHVSKMTIYLAMVGVSLIPRNKENSRKKNKRRMNSLQFCSCSSDQLIYLKLCSGSADMLHIYTNSFEKTQEN